MNNYKTYRGFGDGGVGCDWRAVAGDGGTVTFPNGVSGIWDTYAHAPCVDGGTASGCFATKAFVPGTVGADGGAVNYTYVLYPMDCANDLAGQ